MSEIRNSVKATYDSRATGPRYWVTTTVDGRAVNFRQSIPDPFVRATVEVRSWRDLLLGLLRRRLVVEVTVGADVELMNDVLELDEDTLIAGRTRQAAFQQSMHGRLGSFGEQS